MDGTLTLDEPVTLVFDDLRIPARVDAVFPGRSELVLDHVPARLQRAASMPGLIHREAAAGLGGIVRLLPPSADGSLLAELRFDPTPAPAPARRREDPHETIEVPAGFEREDGSGTDGTTIDVSAGGLLLRGPLRVAPGERVWAWVTVPGSEEIVGGPARVVRTTAEGDAALAFVELPPADRGRLAAAVLERRQGVRA
jgi:PilZ domain